VLVRNVEHSHIELTKKSRIPKKCCMAQKVHSINNIVRIFTKGEPIGFRNLQGASA
jgi:hypothetical protein